MRWTKVVPTEIGWCGLIKVNGFFPQWVEVARDDDGEVRLHFPDRGHWEDLNLERFSVETFLGPLPDPYAK